MMGLRPERPWRSLEASTHSPPVQAKQLPAKRRQLSGGIACLLPATWVSGEGVTFGGDAVMPGSDAPLAERLVVFFGGHHGDDNEPLRQWRITSWHDRV